ncbi:UDP-glucose dehydrogenase family protein [Actinomyces oricola]
MKISVIGCGYLGAVHAACMTHLGHEVLGVDVDASKVARLNQGLSPFHEPGFDTMLTAGLNSGRLRFTTSPSPADLAGVEVHFLAVGTPQTPGRKAADLSHLWRAVGMLCRTLPRDGATVVAGKSTVPVGTAAAVEKRLAPLGAALVWNPEFLREGFAVADTLNPDRIVYGLSADPDRADRGQAALDAVYSQMLAASVPRILTDFATAELTKTAANSFLATKISFINAMAEICEKTGGDVVTLAEAIGHDPRIGRRFLRAGVGFGGGCLPKDIRAFTARAQEIGAGESVRFLAEVDAINLRRRRRVTELAASKLGRDVAGARVTVLGAAFKPNSDDIRDSPALDVAERLAQMGARVTVCDPRALEAVGRHYPHLHTEPDPVRALQGADLVLLLTEWSDFVDLDPFAAAQHVARPAIIDGRNALDPTRWRNAGWSYTGLGRP